MSEFKISGSEAIVKPDTARKYYSKIRNQKGIEKFVIDVE
jgi:hypothetical protein